jgi:hypothetical protein
MGSGNAFCVVSCGDDKDKLILVVLQFTVGENHPIKVKGLEEIVSLYSNTAHKQIGKKLLVFVTPTNSKLDTVQPWYTKENKVAFILIILTRVKNFFPKHINDYHEV